MTRWTLADIPWEDFDPDRVDVDTLKIVKAASMVEHNGNDYATYLCSVFADDPDFQDVARIWAREEVQHGRALARWAMMADPDFDFESSFKRFTDGYRFPLHANRSVRGSKTGEFVARCIVEIGTSSFYSALRDSVDEPVLKAVCALIAADEVRHYNMFRKQMNRYHEREGIGIWRKLWIAVCRIREAGDDELAYAYYAANGGDEPYDRARFSRAYLTRTFPRYRLGHVERGISMLLKAVGLRHRGRLARTIARLAYRLMTYRLRLARAGV